MDEVEREFNTRYWRRKAKALRKLVDLIDSADDWIGRHAASQQGSVYHQLLNAYPSSHFISFNYDCLLEMALSSRGEWFPHDGFGVRAEVGHSREPGPIIAPPKSKHLVLHLHGSTHLYSLDYLFYDGWSTMRKRPRFIYDAGNVEVPLGSFTGASLRRQWASYQDPPKRIITPVPNKGDFMFGGYIRAVFQRAQKMLSAAKATIAIGYRFADSDSDSWLPLLDAVVAAHISLLVIAPDANDIVGRLAARVAKLRIRGIETTLGGWAIGGFAA